MSGLCNHLVERSSNRYADCDRILYLSNNGHQLIAIDKIGAGIGEYVLVAQGSAARIGSGMPDAPIDAAIVGIIDDGSGLE